MTKKNYLLTFHMTWSYGACLQAYATLEALKMLGCETEILNFINPHEKKGNEKPLELFHMTWSYGACLQAYATLEALKMLGCETEILNFINPHEKKGNEKPLELIRGGDIKAGLVAAAKNIMFKRDRLHARAFEHFHASLPRSERVFTSCEQMSDLEADTLIVGSDQVWNPFITGGIEPAFFLQFGNARRRISIASSLGSHCYSEGEQREVAGYLSSLDAISVREAHAVEQIAPLVDKSVFRCLDPTLLLDRSYWRAFSRKPEGFSGDERYILVFNLASRSDAEMALWKRLSSETRLPLWRINNNTYKDKVFDRLLLGMTPEEFVWLVDHASYVITDSFHGTRLPLWRINNNTYKDKVFDRLLLGMTPEEFVWLVDHASYVITDSFHGTAFSVNMGTPFVSMEPIRGNRARIVDLLDLIGLQDRMLEEDADRLPSIEMDYTAADLSLDAERVHCMEWIEGALHG